MPCRFFIEFCAHRQRQDSPAGWIRDQWPDDPIDRRWHRGCWLHCGADMTQTESAHLTTPATQRGLREPALDKKRTVVMLRSVVVISTSYLILFGNLPTRPLSIAYIAAMILSNVA